MAQENSGEGGPMDGMTARQTALYAGDMARSLQELAAHHGFDRLAQILGEAAKEAARVVGTLP